MRRLANLFLILFLLAAVLAGASHLMPHPSLAWLAAETKGLTRFLALPVAFGLGFYPSLSKRLFLPLLATLLWGLLDFWPLEPLTGSDYRLCAAAVQLLFGLLTLRSIRRDNGSSFLLRPSHFAPPDFSRGKIVRFALVSLLLLPILLLLIAYAAVSSLCDTRLAGFVRLQPNGLYLVEKVYAREGKEIRLAGMIHLGQKAYYDQLAASFNAGGTLLLAEGVSDTKGLLKDKLNYDKMADLLGLTTQQQLRFPGRFIEAASLDQPAAVADAMPDILRADVDLQDFDPRTIAALNAIAATLLGNSSPKEGWREFMRWSKANATAETNRILIEDVLHKRNRAVLGYLDKGLQKYTTVLIPWGALHMPEIEAEVKRRGFILRETRARLSIDFRTLPYARLWQ